MAGEPEITLTIDQESVKANVDPNSDGVVTLTGEVTCEMPSYIPNNVYCVVELRADAGGWPVSVPPELTFSQSISVNNFAISAVVPLESPTTESRDVFLSGTWYYSPGNQGGSVNSDSAYIEIQPYSYLEVQNTEVNISLDGGSSRSVQVSVTNSGNSNADIMVGATADDPSIEVEIEETQYTISPNQKAEVELKIKDTKNENGLYQVTFWVESVDYSNQGRVTRNFRVQVKEDRFSIDDIPFLIPGAVLIVVAIAIGAGFMFLRKRRSRKRELNEDIEI